MKFFLKIKAIGKTQLKLKTTEFNEIKLALLNYLSDSKGLHTFCCEGCIIDLTIYKDGERIHYFDLRWKISVYIKKLKCLIRYNRNLIVYFDSRSGNRIESHKELTRSIDKIIDFYSAETVVKAKSYNYDEFISSDNMIIQFRYFPGYINNLKRKIEDIDIDSSISFETRMKKNCIRWRSELEYPDSLTTHTNYKSYTTLEQDYCISKNKSINNKNFNVVINIDWNCVLRCI